MYVTTKVRPITKYDRQQEHIDRCEHENCIKSATKKVSGEEDSFGIEWLYFCDEHAEIESKEMNEAVISGCCDWCKQQSDKLSRFRDSDEGSNGPVYDVCDNCISKTVKAAQEEYEQSGEYKREMYNQELYEEDVIEHEFDDDPEY